MTLKRPLLMQAGGGDTEIEYSALDVRALVEAVFTTEGVTGGANALKVSQRGAGANFSVDIAAGFAVITGDDATDQGRYICQNTSTANIAVPTTLPVSGTRIHRVIARVKDKLHEASWSTYEWTLEVLEDTGSGTPALPDSAITLALITVGTATPSITDGIITDQRTTAQTSGGTTSVASAAARPSSPAAGDRIWRTDRKYYEVYDGTTWRIDGPDINLYKPSDTARDTTTTLADDPHLTGTIPASVQYKLVGQIIYSTRSDTDIKFKLLVPTNGSWDGTLQALQPADTGIKGDVSFEREVHSSQYTFGGAAADNTQYLVIRVDGVVDSGDGGTIKVQWAQVTSNANSTYVRGKSHLTLTPIN